MPQFYPPKLDKLTTGIEALLQMFFSALDMVASRSASLWRYSSERELYNNWMGAISAAVAALQEAYEPNLYDPDQRIERIELVKVIPNEWKFQVEMQLPNATLLVEFAFREKEGGELIKIERVIE